MDIPAITSDRIVIAIETPTMRRKIFQIVFHKRDGSIFLVFPYYKHTEGLLTLATMDRKKVYPGSLSLVDGGKVTSHKVKYSHHPDGETHFSQDRKIYTVVRKKSPSFLELDGHIFTVQFQGLSDFQEITEAEPGISITPQKSIINFKFNTIEPPAIKIIAHAHRLSRLLTRIESINQTPSINMVRPNGSIAQGYLIKNKNYINEDSIYILLHCEGIPTINPDEPSLLTLMAGFDSDRIVLDHNRDTQLLIMAYPISGDKSTLVAQIGSVDYVSNS